MALPFLAFWLSLDKVYRWHSTSFTPACHWNGRQSYWRTTGFATPGEAAAQYAAKAQNFKPPSREICHKDVELRFSRSSGPGGQNVNKVETRVEAQFHVRSSFLPDWVKEKLVQQQATKMNKDGFLIVATEEQRTQSDNLRLTFRKLQAMIDQAAIIPKLPSKAKVEKMKRIKKAANTKRIEDKRFKSARKSMKIERRKQYE
eukprot:TRINITY_DN18050_c2_g2_i1.p1 TRINITY_DN18050_c2_g2~~TRINITY_DN18050_c2_g2_i1.p1  ORF type:complete len:202 (-),score=43.71 TRINITY_DN18050_c2_g2_i1:46-651(-)